MEKAFQTDKAVQISNFKTKFDEWNSKEVITLSSNASLCYSTVSIDFDAKKYSQQINEITKLSDITHLVVGTTVNVDVFVDIDNCKEEEVSTRFGVKKKKDVSIYDESLKPNSSLKLCLWSECAISKITESGVYKLKDVKLSSFKGKFLTTINTTDISPSTTPIKRRDLKVELERTVSLPAESINIFERKYYCKRCFHPGVTSGKFVICDNCDSKSLTTKCDNRYICKVTFRDEDTNVVLTVPHMILVKFSEIIGKDLEANVEDVEEELFSNNTLKFKFN